LGGALLGGGGSRCFWRVGFSGALLVGFLGVRTGEGALKAELQMTCIPQLGEIVHTLMTNVNDHCTWMNEANP
jgi:hypothetical protein